MQQLPPPPKRSTFASSALDWAKAHKVLSIAGAFFLMMAALNVAVAGPGEGPGKTRTPTPSLAPTSVPSPSVDPEPVIPTSKVPSVEGMQLQNARTRLEARGFEVSVETKLSHGPAGKVLRQSIRAGERVEEGTTIKLTVAKAFPRVPVLAGVKGKTAKKRLSNAGFDVVIRLQESSSVAAGTVISSMPAAGTEVRPGATISLIVAKAPPPPPPSTPSCHPSYIGACLDPSASDYDCAGGSGDGPKYTGPVRVVGYDEYDLDSDGDGYGCES